MKMNLFAPILGFKSDGLERLLVFIMSLSIRSHDGFKTNNEGYMDQDSGSSPYASQQKVFDELGKGVLDNAFEGQ